MIRAVEEQNRHADQVYAVVREGIQPAGASLNSDISRSWSRCLEDYHLEPDKAPEPVVIESAQLRERQERLCDLLSLARAEMTNLYQQVAGSGYAILLVDTGGVVLHYVGDPSFSQAATDAGLRPGGVWSEQAQGTNGMGTCLAEAKPLVIHRHEHFLSKNTLLTCSATPIRNPHGEMVAVLDASSESIMGQQHTMALVNMSARMIENRIFLCASRNRFVLRFHSRPEFINTLGEGNISFDATGQVVAANDSALFQLGHDQRESLVGRSIEEVFDIKVPNLIARALSHPLQTVPIRDARDGRRFFALFQPPEGEMAGRNPEGLGPRAAPVLEAEASVRATPKLDELALGDPQMAANVRIAKRILNRDIPVLLLGETGTGKGVFAKALHDSGKRSEAPFVAVNCASIPESLIESELFGYRAGAFTGANRKGSRGKILLADGGTLFLDEIGDMPLALQARLLRVLEEREVVPLGCETPITVDIQVISATHRDLRELVAEGRFREDLYYRLQGVTLTLPALRDRQDRCALIGTLLQAENMHDGPVALEEGAMEVLERFPWPGNIRQLRNVLRTLLALSDGHTVTRADLPPELLNGAAPIPAAPAGESDPAEPEAPEINHNSLELAERDALLRELERCRWNISRVAERLNLSRNTLYRKMKRFNITPPSRQTLG